MIIKELVVLVKLDDNSLHQVLLTPEDSEVVLNLIPQIDDSKTIRVLEQPIEGIEIKSERLNYNVNNTSK